MSCWSWGDPMFMIVLVTTPCLCECVTTLLYYCYDGSFQIWCGRFTSDSVQHALSDLYRWDKSVARSLQHQLVGLVSLSSCLVVSHFCRGPQYSYCNLLFMLMNSLSPVTFHLQMVMSHSSGSQSLCWCLDLATLESLHVLSNLDFKQNWESYVKWSFH